MKTMVLLRKFSNRPEATLEAYKLICAGVKVSLIRKNGEYYVESRHTEQ